MTAATPTASPDRLSSPGAVTSAVVGAIVVRSLVRVRRMPSAFLPSLAMPVFQVIAFSGAFGAAVRFAGIQDALDWYVPLAAIQGASFGALGISFLVINDLQSGFFDRLLMAPARRWSLVLGPLAAAVVRAIVPIVLVVAVGLIGGMNTPGGVLGLAMMAVASLGVAFVAAGFALGLALRIRDLGAAALTQFAIFFTIFLSTSQVPLAYMQGWLHAVARVNPMTNVLRLARQGLLGEVTWEQTWGGLLALVVLGTASTLFARRSLATFDR